MSTVEKALGLLKNLPRVTIGNLRALPGSRFNKKSRRGQHGGNKSGRGKRGQGKTNTLPRIGFEGGNTPFYLRIPQEPYYSGHHTRKQYPPVSLLQIQRLVDLGRLDMSEPIDLTSICNTRILDVRPQMRHYGVNLTEEGSDIFSAKVNIEVQWADEMSIAAVEKNGGTIMTRFYDIQAVEAMIDPLKFFKKGVPIPRCKLPSPDVIEYYSDAKNRGYLADPEKIQEARLELAQKYGYRLPDISKDELFEMLTRRKDPRQLWFGLSPGWVVNMREKTVLKPKDTDLKTYYES